MSGVRAIVLDLRGNAGGLFTAAVKTAERFLPGGIIVTAQGQTDDANKVYTSTTGNAASDLPMIVLVDRRRPAPPRSWPWPCGTTGGPS